MRAGETPALPIPTETELLPTSTSLFNFPPMSAVAEIEDALNKLPENEFEEVAFIVLERLRKTGHLPPVRSRVTLPIIPAPLGFPKFDFTADQINELETE